MKDREEMEAPVRDVTLENGIRLRVFDRSRMLAPDAKKPLADPRGTRRVAGDIWVVGFSIRVTVEVDAALAGEPDREEALSVLGPEAILEKEFMRHLVHESEKEEKLAEVQKDLDAFWAYLSRPAFPARLVRAEVKSKTRPAPAGPWARR